MIVVHVLVKFPRFNVKHINQDFDITEDVFLLRLEVLVHVRLLSSTVGSVTRFREGYRQDPIDKRWFCMKRERKYCKSKMFTLELHIFH